jgi:hypothetical protein
MRLKIKLIGLLLIFLGFTATAALAVDIDVERVQDAKAYLCPRCQKAIRTGDIRENAELMLADALKTSLGSRHIPYTEGKEKNGLRLSVLVYRFQERKGSGIAVDKPASVGFHAHLYKGDALVKTVIFDETQQPLSENVFRFFTFLKRGGKWITVDELCREGVERVVDDLEKDLEESKQ